MEEKFDIIIIGSGLGGLVCGYILAKNGYKVAIVEKNAQIGGCLQTFSRFGVKFDTGMHYIGAVDDGQILNKIFRYLNLLGDIKLSKLDSNGYDHFSIGGKHYTYANGYDQFVETLAAQFPNNVADLKRYVADLQTITSTSPIYNLKPIMNITGVSDDYLSTSAGQFLENITANKTLQNVLAGNLPLYAGVKNATPMYISAMINNLYIQSAYRFVGGSDQLAKSLAKSIQDFGGSIFTNSAVEAITCDEVQALSVKLRDGGELFGQRFISAIHPQVLLPMVQSDRLRKTYRDRIHSIGNTISNFTIYIKFKENRVPYNNFNFYYYRDADVWKSLQQQPNTEVQNYWFMHQCHEENCQFAQSAKLISFMDFREVERWASTTVGKRGNDYEAFKQCTAEKYLHALAESFPNILNDIEAYETSSPLTYRDYTATQNGAMYGVLRDAAAPLQTTITPRTKIPNLFLTGQNTNSHGIFGTIMGAIVTCAHIIDVNKIITEINQ